MPKKEQVKIGDQESFKKKLKGSDTPPPVSPGEKPKKIRRTKAEIKAAQEQLASVPNPLFVPVIKAPFDLWSESVKLPSLKLTDTEATSLALPITQLVEYYLPKMPSIAVVWASLAVTSYNIMYPRLSELKKIRDSKPQPEKPEKPEEKKKPGEKFPDEHTPEKV